MESNVYLTSVAGRGRAAWERTPARRWEGEGRGSGVFQESARSPWKFIWSSRSRRLLKRRPSIFWDWESVAKRGSRLVALDSIRKVRVEESLLLWREQPTKRKRKDVTQRAQRRRRVRGEVCALFGRGIADFTENGRGVRAGGAGEIARAATPGFIG